MKRPLLKILKSVHSRGIVTAIRDFIKLIVWAEDLTARLCSLDNLIALNDLAEDHVLAIEPRRGDRAQEEPAPMASHREI
jgi:hypothetical protein